MRVVTVKDLKEYLNRPNVNDDDIILPLISALDDLQPQDVPKMMAFIEQASKDHFLKCKMGIATVSRLEAMSPKDATTAAASAFFLTHN